MVNKITTPPTQNEVIDKINELVDDKQDNISDLATIRSGATGNVKLDGGSATQTVSLTSGTGTTALGVKSKSTSSYISFSASGGWLASFGITSDKKPTIYDGTSHVIAYTTDIPTVNNATLTIQKNGSNVATFTANASSNVTANISVPNTVSSVSSSSTNADAVGAKLFYDTVGDIEAALHTINSAETVTLTVVRTGTYASGNENGSVGITINDVIYAGSDFVNNQLEVEFPKNTEVVWSSISTGSGRGHLYSTPSNGTLTLTNDTTLTLEINIYSGGAPDKY